MFTRALTRRFPVLANRNFRLLLADRLLAPMAATFSLVGVSFAVLAATGSTADLSYVIAAQAAPSLVFLLVGGVIADRIAPQLVIVVANVMVAVGEGLFGVMAEIKACFDPHNLFNPGKIVHDGRFHIDENLRLGPGKRLELPFAPML